MRLKLTVEYDGTPFRGWAAQPGLPTVEGALREALRETFSSVDSLAVAGRTDAGVHALANVVTVDVEGGPSAARAAQALNTRLPEEISCCFVSSLRSRPIREVSFFGSAALRSE